MASQNSVAISASFGLNIPLSTIFNFVRDRILAIVFQFKDKSLFAKYQSLPFRSNLLEASDSSSRMGSLYLFLSILYLIYFLRVPMTCASSVITMPWNPLASAIYISFSVTFQSLVIQICSIFKPELFTFAIFEGWVLERVLRIYPMFCSLAIFAGIISASQEFTKALIAQGANPKGSAHYTPKMLVLKSTEDPSRSTLVIKTYFWKAFSLFFLVDSSSEPESIQQKISGGRTF